MLVKTSPRYDLGLAPYAATFLPNTTSSNDGSGLISGASSLADCSVVSTSAGSSLKSSAFDGSGSQSFCKGTYRYRRLCVLSCRVLSPLSCEKWRLEDGTETSLA